MNVFVHCHLIRSHSAVHGFSTGADLSDGVEVGAFRTTEMVRDTAVADESGVVVDSGTTLDEAVRTCRIGKQRARIILALVVAGILLGVVP